MRIEYEPQERPGLDRQVTHLTGEAHPAAKITSPEVKAASGGLQRILTGHPESALSLAGGLRRDPRVMTLDQLRGQGAEPCPFIVDCERWPGAGDLGHDRHLLDRDQMLLHGLELGDGVGMP